jgi:hypothetical protein
VAMGMPLLQRRRFLMSAAVAEPLLAPSAEAALAQLQNAAATAQSVPGWLQVRSISLSLSLSLLARAAAERGGHSAVRARLAAGAKHLSLSLSLSLSPRSRSCRTRRPQRSPCPAGCRCEQFQSHFCGSGRVIVPVHSQRGT